MIDRVVSVAGIISAVGAGVTAGVMLAFSVSVVPGLRTLPTPTAVAAMQSANSSILNPVFLLLFMGTAASCTVTAVAAPFSLHGTTWLYVAGAVLFVVGCFAVTMAVNVPLNDTLAAIDPNSAAAQGVWDHFTTQWMLWNNARTVAAVASCAVLIVAIPTGGR